MASGTFGILSGWPIRQGKRRRWSWLWLRREFGDLKSQSVISSGGHGRSPEVPSGLYRAWDRVLSGVLRSNRAIVVNIEILVFGLF
jgi:hypothetical protein